MQMVLKAPGKMNTLPFSNYWPPLPPSLPSQHSHNLLPNNYNYTHRMQGTASHKLSWLPLLLATLPSSRQHTPYSSNRCRCIPLHAPSSSRHPLQ